MAARESDPNRMSPEVWFGALAGGLPAELGTSPRARKCDVIPASGHESQSQEKTAVSRIFSPAVLLSTRSWGDRRRLRTFLFLEKMRQKEPGGAFAPFGLPDPPGLTGGRDLVLFGGRALLSVKLGRHASPGRSPCPRASPRSGSPTCRSQKTRLRGRRGTSVRRRREHKGPGTIAVTGQAASGIAVSADRRTLLPLRKDQTGSWARRLRGTPCVPMV